MSLQTSGCLGLPLHVLVGTCVLLTTKALFGQQLLPLPMAFTILPTCMTHLPQLQQSLSSADHQEHFAFAQTPLVLLQFKGHTMSLPFKCFNIGLASLMAILAICSSIAAVRYIVVSHPTHFISHQA